MRNILFGFIALMLVGCGDRIEYGRAKSNSNVSTLMAANSCSGTQINARVVNTDPDFQSIVADFLSAIFDPTEHLGSISGAPTGSTGIDLQMDLRFDSNHQIDESKSSFMLTVRDSYSVQGTPTGNKYDPIRIVHSSVSDLSGSYIPEDRTLTLIFSDNEGEITITGEIINGSLNGTISFQNTNSWDGSSPKSGQLGTFSANSCNFQ